MGDGLANDSCPFSNSVAEGSPAVPGKERERTSLTEGHGHRTENTSRLPRGIPCGMRHRGKKNSDVATQVLLIAECFKRAHAGKAWRGAHQTLARAISHPPTGSTTSWDGHGLKPDFLNVAPGVLAKRGPRHTANRFVLGFPPL